MRQFLTRIRNWFWDTFGDKEDRLEQERLEEWKVLLRDVKRSKLELMNILKKIETMPGADRDPFAIPLGPTEKCLSSNQTVSFVKGGGIDSGILRHLANCKDCRERLDRFKQVYP